MIETLLMIMVQKITCFMVKKSGEIFTQTSIYKEKDVGMGLMVTATTSTIWITEKFWGAWDTGSRREVCRAHIIPLTTTTKSRSCRKTLLTTRLTNLGGKMAEQSQVRSGGWQTEILNKYHLQHTGRPAAKSLLARRQDQGVIKSKKATWMFLVCDISRNYWKSTVCTVVDHKGQGSLFFFASFVSMTADSYMGLRDKEGFYDLSPYSSPWKK